MSKRAGARPKRPEPCPADDDAAIADRTTERAPHALVVDRRKEVRSDGSDRRRKPRLRVLLTATLETPAGDYAVKLRNLSSTGALIELDRPPDIGTLVTFRRGTTMAPGTVVWATRSMIGLEFLRPIHQSEVLIHINRPGQGW